MRGRLTKVLSFESVFHNVGNMYVGLNYGLLPPVPPSLDFVLRLFLPQFHARVTWERTLKAIYIPADYRNYFYEVLT